MRYYCAKNCYIKESIIGDFTSIGDNCKIFYSKIGKFCSISWNVIIGAPNHLINGLTTHNFPFTTFWGISNDYIIKREETFLGNDVWIGANATILSNINIGNGVIVGANSFVNSNLKPYGIYAGNPAKFIRYRFDNETIEILEEIKWWDWDMDEIKKHLKLFRKEKIKADDLLRFLINR